MEKHKKISFWIIVSLFTIDHFIRLFINPNWGQAIRDVTSSLPLVLKIIITLLFIILLVWLFPYKNNK
ncbi:hypothetical protein HMPREF2829_05540 [Aerococcus sp. HMSC072A12]|nr:hypothetical protein HMPREF2829_05540 [Aerococcus sp. HMSC072A12]OFR33779.1 hypothetical protein HMPREF2892_06135 [Aerococcus sp. HMSC061A03]OFT43685.1 hypothetical protein HMPREF3161_00400 [Aerococcus sp. HMSC06H08]